MSQIDFFISEIYDIIHQCNQNYLINSFQTTLIYLLLKIFIKLIFLKRKERFKKGNKKQMKEKLKYNTVEGIQKKNNKITFRWTKSKKYLLDEFLKINSNKSRSLVNIHIKLNKINQNIFSIKDWKNDASKNQNKQH